MELTDNLNETLLKEKIDLVNEIKSSINPIKNQIRSDGKSIVEIVQSKKLNSKFYDIEIYDNWEQEKIVHRVYTSYFSHKNKVYKITISKAAIEEDDLMESLFSAFGIIITFLTIGFLIANWFISKTLWKPFYRTLDNLNKFDIHTSRKMTFDSLNTKEFDQLNDSLNKMTQKIYTDFIKQKEFNENASHEMQTPLAVIKANISLLMQSKNIKEEEMSQIQVIENSLKKLSALNKGLILLTKIENNQFQDNQKLKVNESISRITHNFNDSILLKELKINTIFDSNLILDMSPVLADVLFTNLIQNSIRHTNNEGEISIYLTNKTFTISNTGDELKINQEDLFQRFKKNDASKDSLGLGLSIVKSIVDSYGFEIKYFYKNQTHYFEIIFN